MLETLNCPGWERVFNHASIRKAGFTREDVARIVRAETPGQAGSESTGYLGLFELHSGQFVALSATPEGEAWDRESCLRGVSSSKPGSVRVFDSLAVRPTEVLSSTR